MTDEEFDELVNAMRQEIESHPSPQRVRALLLRLYGIADMIEALVRLLADEIDQIEPDTSNVIELKQRKAPLRIITNGETDGPTAA